MEKEERVLLVRSFLPQGKQGKNKEHKVFL